MKSHIFARIIIHRLLSFLLFCLLGFPSSFDLTLFAHLPQLIWLMVRVLLSWTSFQPVLELLAYCNHEVNCTSQICCLSNRSAFQVCLGKDFRYCCSNTWLPTRVLLSLTYFWLYLDYWHHEVDGYMKVSTFPLPFAIRLLKCTIVFGMETVTTKTYLVTGVIRNLQHGYQRLILSDQSRSTFASETKTGLAFLHRY